MHMVAETANDAQRPMRDASADVRKTNLGFPPGASRVRDAFGVVRQALGSTLTLLPRTDSNQRP
jgi:hypothetical protein